MAESPLSELLKKSPLLRFGGSGHDGRKIYLTDPNKYSIDGKLLSEFTVLGSKSHTETGVTSARVHALKYVDKKPYYADVAVDYPDGQEMFWKNVGAVAFIDSKGDRIEIPRNELRLKKPKIPSPEPNRTGPSYVEQEQLSDDETLEIITPESKAKPKKPSGKKTDASKIKPTLTPQEAQAYNNMMGNSGEEPDEPVVTTTPPDASQSIPPDPDVQPDLTTPPANPLTGATATSTSRASVASIPTVSTATSASPVTPPPSPIAGPNASNPTPDSLIAHPVVRNLNTGMMPENLRPSSQAGTTPRETLEAKVLGIFGVKTNERRVADLVQKTMESTRSIWKHSLKEFFQEKYRQYYDKLLGITSPPFAEKSIRLAEQKAKDQYDRELTGLNPFERAARKVWEKIKDSTYGETRIQRYTVDILTNKTDAEVNQLLSGEQALFDQEREAFAGRFDAGFDNQDNYIRQQMGEQIKVLDAANPFSVQIKGLVKDYMRGVIPDEATYKQRINTLFDQIKASDPALLGEADTYASTLEAVGKKYKTEFQRHAGHQQGLADLDAKIEQMRVGIGIGSMGEATQMKKTDTVRVIEWFRKKFPVEPNFSDAAWGTAVSFGLSLGILPQFIASKTARVVLGAVGGGAVSGTLAGFRDLRRRRGEYISFLTEREAGITTPQGAKKREWFQTFDIQRRTIFGPNGLIDSMKGPLYSADGRVKQNLTPDEFRASLAHLTDAKARKQLSARAGDRYGLIEIGAVGQQEHARTILDKTVEQVEKDLKAYASTHGTELQSVLGGNDFDTFLTGLTGTQVQIIENGKQVLASLGDPMMKLALDPISQYVPEINKLRGGFFLKSRERVKGQASGLDALLDEFQHQAKNEAIKRGIKTGAIGVGVGMLVQEVSADITRAIQTGGHEWFAGNLSKGLVDRLGGGATPHDLALPVDHLNGGILHMSDNLVVDHQGNIDFMDASGHRWENIIPVNDVTFTNGHLSQHTLDLLTQQAKDHGWQLGITSETLGSAPIVPGDRATHLLDFGAKGSIEAPAGLHWVNNADGTRRLVLDMLDSSGNQTEHIVYPSAELIRGEPDDPTAVLEAIKKDALLHFTDSAHGATITIPYHSIDIPGSNPIIDAAGIPHHLTTGIPTGTDLVPDGSGGFNLVDIAGDNKGDVLIRGMQFDDGQITNLAQINAEAAKHGIDFQIHKDVLTMPGSGDDGSFDKPVIEMGAEHGSHGFWGWVEDPTNTTTTTVDPFDPIQNIDLVNKIPITNYTKHLARTLFENDFSDVPGLKDAHFIRADGSIMPYTDIDARTYTMMYEGDIFKHLPNIMFKDDALIKIGSIAQKAINIVEHQGVDFDHATAVSLGISQQEFDILKSAYEIGRVGREATKDEFLALYQYLGAGGTSAQDIWHVDMIQRITEATPAIITTTSGAQVVENIIRLGIPSDFNPIPIIPIADWRGMEPGTPGVPILPGPNRRRRNVASGSGFRSGSGSGFEAIARLTPETQQFYRDRLSDRLKTTPHMNLDPKIEVPDYIQRQKSEYIQELESYMSQEGMREPMDEHADAIIAIPVYGLGEGQQIQNALENYYMQIDKTTNKQAIDPSKFEIIIFLNHPKPMREKLEADIGKSIYDGSEERVRTGKPEVYDTEEVIKQFMANHPELRVRVMKKEYDQRQLWGNIIKPLYDVGIMRAVKRTNPFRRDPVIITNDVDLVRMSPTYVRDILKSMDLNEIATWRHPTAKKIDGAIGNTDMAKESYQTVPGFLLSQRFFHFLESVNHPINRSTQGRNTILRASTYAAIGGVNPNTDNGADGELERIISFARGGDQTTLPFLHKAYLETDPRREIATWTQGVPYMYNWNSWAAMDLYGKNWKDRFNNPVVDPTKIDKPMLELEINETIKNWFGGSMNPFVERAMTFIGLKPGDYHIVKTTDDQGRPWEKIEIDRLTNISTDLKQYVDEKRWEIANRRREKQKDHQPESHVIGNYYAEYTDYEEFDQIYEDIFLSDTYGTWKPSPGKSDPTIIDLGSHIGMSLLYWKTKVPGAKITAVEANPDTTEILKRNIDRNHLSDVTVVQGAASSKTGNVDLYKPKAGVDFRWGDFVGGRPVDASKYDVTQVPAVKLSDLITDPVDLLKVDIEGSELEVLKEAEPKLGQVKEMIIEFHNEPENPTNSITECLELLRRQGYQINVTLWDKPVDVSTQDLSQKLFFMISAKRP